MAFYISSRQLWRAAVLLIMASQPGLAADPAGRVVNVNGTSSITTGAGSRDRPRPLQVGDSVFEGAIIRTDARSGVKLFMADKSILDIGESTTFTVTRYSADDSSRNVDMSLDFGNVRAAISKKLDKKARFFIRTKSSVLSVRGTELIAKSQVTDRQVTEEVTVVEGTVELTTGRKSAIALTGGQQFTTSGHLEGGIFVSREPASLPKIVKLSPSETAKLAENAKIADHTFQQAVVFDDTSSHGQRTLLTNVTDVMSSQKDTPTPPTTVALRDVPAATGQETSSTIPGFPGFSGTNVQLPTTIVPQSPQLPVNIQVIYAP